MKIYIKRLKNFKKSRNLKKNSKKRQKVREYKKIFKSPIKQLKTFKKINQ